MVSTTADVHGSRVAVPPSGLSWWVSDVWQMVLRNVRHILRSPELVSYALIQPVMFILLFTFVFGGAISTPGGDYTQFLLPGVFVQMVLFGSVAGTTVGIATDMQRGLMDRFRSMPMSRSAVLVGRTVSEVFRNVVTAVVMVVVGLLVGFQFLEGLLPALGGMLLLLLFGYSLSWFAAFIGLSVGSAEAAQTAGTVWTFPFSFISSAFVPTESMPGWLRVYADYSPMTAVVNAMRSLFSGAPAGTYVLQTLAWSIGLILVFAPLAVRKYRSRSR
jgi:ABC-2 type transport system permease protein/oleandomycin transport system permease protein